MSYRIPSIALLALAAACAGGAPTSHHADGVAAGAIGVGGESLQNPLEGRHVYGGLQERERIVVANQVEWHRLWSRMNGNMGVEPSHPAPPVDFDQHMVVVASMGTQSGGSAITIDGVYRLGSNLYVVVRELSPGRGCAVTRAITNPVTAALLPRTPGRVVFVDQRSVRACD